MISGTGRSVIAGVESAWGVIADNSVGKKLRRTRLALNTNKAQFQDDEIRDDYQKVRPSSGGQKVEGSLECGLSCGSHQAFFEALLRKTAASVSSITGVQLDVSGSGPTYVIHRDSGNFITDGVRVGMVIRPTAGLTAASLNRNLLVTALDSDDATVYPLDAGTLTTETNVSSCTIQIPGKRIIVPSTGHIERSFTIEDLVSSTFSRQFLGVEIASLALDLSPGANAKATFGFLGKREINDTSAYFVSPTALSTNPRLSGPKGVILMEGEVQAVITQVTANVNGNLSTDDVVGSNYVPAIGQGSVMGTGQVTMLLVDETFTQKYLDDEPFELVVYMNETAAANSDFMLFHFPDCLATKADIDDSEKLLRQTLPFTFSKKATTTGYDSTTFAVQDSQYA